MLLEAFAFIVLILLCFAGVFADVLIIYTLLRFKKLRSPFNTFLANWAISDLCSIILVPVTTLTTFFAHSSTSFTILLQAALIIHVTEVLFGIVLCIDWCLAAYYQTLHEKFNKYYRYVIATIWVLTVVFYIIVSSLSAVRYDIAVTMILFAIFYSISLIFVISLQGSRIAQKLKTFPLSYPQPLPMRLTLITVIILSYLFAAIYMLMGFLEAFYHTMRDYTFIFAMVSVAAVLSSSIVTLILLCWLNYDFRQCLFQLKELVRQEQFDNDVSEAEDKKTAPEIFPPSTENIVTNGHTDLV